MTQDAKEYKICADVKHKAERLHVAGGQRDKSSSAAATYEIPHHKSRSRQKRKL